MIDEMTSVQDPADDPAATPDEPGTTDTPTEEPAAPEAPSEEPSTPAEPEAPVV